MEGALYDANGTRWVLPVLTGWEVTHTLGQPCDAFEVQFAYQKEMLPVLKSACRFSATHDGNGVFTGVVDRYTVTCNAAGNVARVQGRGLAALLMDNEAESGSYYGLRVDELVRGHVSPWGISRVETAETKPVGQFTVSSGQSEWSVLREYLMFSGGLQPRFDRFGTLLLDGKTGGETYVIDGDTAISDVEFSDDRYGVVSAVLVKKTRSAVGTTVENAALIARGGSARRVLNVPRRTEYDAMRYTGAYQIEQSRAGSAVCTLTLPKLFAAFAGDTVELRDSPVGLTGKFRVSQSRCWAQSGSFGTELTLAVWEDW